MWRHWSGGGVRLAFLLHLLNFLGTRSQIVNQNAPQGTDSVLFTGTGTNPFYGGEQTSIAFRTLNFYFNLNALTIIFNTRF